jgi:hypothetical protein
VRRRRPSTASGTTPSVGSRRATTTAGAGATGVGAAGTRPEQGTPLPDARDSAQDGVGAPGTGTPAFEDAAAAAERRGDLPQEGLGQDPAPQAQADAEHDPFFAQERLLREQDGELPPEAPEFGADEDGTAPRR